jgi:hypothetical protein
MVKDGNDRTGERSMDQVFHQLLENPQWETASLFSSQAVGAHGKRVDEFRQVVVSDRVVGHRNDDGRGVRVDVYRDAGRIRAHVPAATAVRPGRIVGRPQRDVRRFCGWVLGGLLSGH